jgi:two-component system phosphate regulon sensor histidine kinase PhoR
MKTSLYLLERAVDPERRKEKLAQIEEQIDLFDRYIQDMLAISRLEYLPGFRKEAIELQPMIAEVVERLRPRADQKQIDCQIRQDGPLPPIMADADQFRRALVNLIENAINYTPPNGTIIVSADHDNETAVITVQDTGMGIAAEDLPRIFERFYRAPAARSVENKGTGLGLAIVKRIIDMHNGTIEVSSELGHGTIFRIRLPV